MPVPLRFRRVAADGRANLRLGQSRAPACPPGSHRWTGESTSQAPVADETSTATGNHPMTTTRSSVATTYGLPGLTTAVALIPAD